LASNTDERSVWSRSNGLSNRSALQAVHWRCQPQPGALCVTQPVAVSVQRAAINDKRYMTCGFGIQQCAGFILIWLAFVRLERGIATAGFAALRRFTG